MEYDFVPDVPRDERFFGFMRKLFSRMLKAAYDNARFVKGDPHDFARVVGERDKSVGLHVKFPEIAEDGIVYEFHTDPFPGLKDRVDPRLLDATYMNFKVWYLLGDDWSYETPERIRENGTFTRHIITKRQSPHKELQSERRIEVPTVM